jgi:hypothetical protein
LYSPPDFSFPSLRGHVSTSVYQGSFPPPPPPPAISALSFYPADYHNYNYHQYGTAYSAAAIAASQTFYPAATPSTHLLNRCFTAALTPPEDDVAATTALNCHATTHFWPRPLLQLEEHHQAAAGTAAVTPSPLSSAGSNLECTAEKEQHCLDDEIREMRADSDEALDTGIWKFWVEKIHLINCT